MKRVILGIVGLLVGACTEPYVRHSVVNIEGHGIVVKTSPSEVNSWSAHHANMGDRLKGDINMIRRNNIAIETVSECKIIPTANVTSAATTVAVVSC